MSDFEYVIAPRPGDGRRWRWEGGAVSFDASQGGEIIDWSDVVSGRFTGADC